MVLFRRDVLVTAGLIQTADSFVIRGEKIRVPVENLMGHGRKQSAEWLFSGAVTFVSFPLRRIKGKRY